MSFLEYLAQVLGTDVETVMYGLELGAFAAWSYMLENDRDLNDFEDELEDDIEDLEEEW